LIKLNDSWYALMGEDVLHEAPGYLVRDDGRMKLEED
jgi:hypothetical protein